MTNEEKAKEISQQRCYDRNLQIAVYEDMMQMAEWKDNKFYLILACIKVSLEKAGLNGDKFIDEIKKQWEE